MKTLEEQTLRVCGCCKRPLPTDAFYISRATGLPGNYCKECRKSASRNSRQKEKCSLTCGKEESYPVITRTEDPALRHALILHALEVVSASMERKRRKERESELARTDL